MVMLAVLLVGASAAAGAPATVDLDFDATVPGTVVDGDGQGTGFDAVVPNAAGNAYQPDHLDLRPAEGLLEITAMAGSNTSANTLRNHLDVTIDATGTTVVGARILGPLTPLSAAVQQGGVIFGPSQDDYVKLVASATNSTRIIQFYREIGGTSRAQIAAKVFTQQEWDAIQTLDLYLRTEPGTGVVTAEYSIDGAPRESITTAGGEASYTIPSGSLSTFFGPEAHAGLVAFTGSAAEVPVAFDWFRVGECVAVGGSPSITSVSPVDGATDVARNTPVTTELDLPNCDGVDQNTLTSETARIVDTTTEQPVDANVNTTGGGDAIIVQPTGLLASNRTYRFEVTSGVEDLSGQPFAPFQSTFTTGTTTGETGGSFTGSFTPTPTSAPRRTPARSTASRSTPTGRSGPRSRSRRSRPTRAARASSSASTSTRRRLPPRPSCGCRTTSSPSATRTTGPGRSAASAGRTWARSRTSWSTCRGRRATT
jgi:hypothetical protein